LNALAPWLAAAALLGASAAQAQDRIDIEPPPGWAGGWTIAANLRGEGWSRIDFRPVAQTADLSRQAVTLLEIWGGSQRDGASRLLGSWEADVRKTCPEARAFRNPVRNANGFSVLYVQFLCPKRSDTGEGAVHFLKTISSDKHTFLVAAVRGSGPFTVEGTDIRYADTSDVEALGRWINSTNPYLENVHACDSHSQFVTVCSP